MRWRSSATTVFWKPILNQKLGYAWDEVHNEADRLEHVISEELEERISLALGDPSFDPHGDPIPTREFQMPDRSNLRMSELHPGDRATVQRIMDSDPDLLRYLSSIGLTLDTGRDDLGSIAIRWQPSPANQRTVQAHRPWRACDQPNIRKTCVRALSLIRRS